MAADVRARQIDAVKHMLNLNSPKSDSTWKILVFDEYGRDIIAPLLTVKELRECGVTLNLLVADKRDPIPDVPVVYFVMPTKENIDLISQDCKNHMYEKFYINFITAVSRQLLEDLAQATIESDTVARVEKIFDQYLSKVGHWQFPTDQVMALACISLLLAVKCEEDMSPSFGNMI